MVYLSSLKDSSVMDFSKSSAKKSISYINKIKPDYLVVCSAYPCLRDELKILSQLNIPFILSNPNYDSIAKKLFENNHLLKGILLYPDALELRNFLLKNKKSNMILTSKDYERKKINKMNFSYPDFKIFLNRNYKLPFFRKKFALITASFGCSGGCKFCSISRIGYFARKVEEVVDEMNALYIKGFRNFYFQDPDFFKHPEWEKILSLAPLNAKLSIQGSLWKNLFADFDYWKKVINIRTGIESGSEKLLKIQNKFINKKILYNNIRFFEKKGISTIGFFIDSLPGEGLSDYLKSIFFSIRLSPTFITISEFTVDPGSSYFEEGARDKGIRGKEKKSGRSSMGIPFIKRIIWYFAFYFRISSIKRIINLNI